MTAFAAFGVDTNRDTTLAADLVHCVDEIPAFHGFNSRSVVSELSSGIPDRPVFSVRCDWSHDSAAHEERRTDREEPGCFSEAIRAGGLGAVLGASVAAAGRGATKCCRAGSVSRAQAVPKQFEQREVDGEQASIGRLVGRGVLLFGHILAARLAEDPERPGARTGQTPLTRRTRSPRCC